MDFVPLLLMVACIKKVVDLIKYATNADINGLITQVVAWAAGIGVVAVMAHSDFASTAVINGVTLESLNWAGIAIAGTVVASAAGFGWDTLKSLDNTNSAIVPNLTHPRVARPVENP